MFEKEKKKFVRVLFFFFSFVRMTWMANRMNAVVEKHCRKEYFWGCSDIILYIIRTHVWSACVCVWIVEYIRILYIYLFKAPITLSLIIIIIICIIYTWMREYACTVYSILICVGISVNLIFAPCANFAMLRNIKPEPDGATDFYFIHNNWN